MPDNYTIIGDYQIASPSGSKKCVRNVNQVFDIPINWQPVWRLNDPKFNLSQFYDPNDELGWSYSYLETSNHTRTYNIKELIDVIPDDNPDMPHSVVKGCNPQTPPQPYAITANPNWKVVGSKSVIYEGNTPATVTKVAEIADADEGSTSTDRGPHSTHTQRLHPKKLLGLRAPLDWQPLEALAAVLRQRIMEASRSSGRFGQQRFGCFTMVLRRLV